MTARCRRPAAGRRAPRMRRRTGPPSASGSKATSVQRRHCRHRRRAARATIERRGSALRPQIERRPRSAGGSTRPRRAPAPRSPAAADAAARHGGWVRGVGGAGGQARSAIGAGAAQRRRRIELEPERRQVGGVAGPCARRASCRSPVDRRGAAARPLKRSRRASAPGGCTRRSRGSRARPSAYTTSSIDAAARRRGARRSAPPPNSVDQLRIGSVRSSCGRRLTRLVELIDRTPPGSRVVEADDVLERRRLRDARGRRAGPTSPPPRRSRR